jgi:hypothetical protein
MEYTIYGILPRVLFTYPLIAYNSGLVYLSHQAVRCIITEVYMGRKKHYYAVLLVTLQQLTKSCHYLFNLPINFIL